MLVLVSSEMALNAAKGFGMENSGMLAISISGMFGSETTCAKGSAEAVGIVGGNDVVKGTSGCV